jgi:glycerol-3-phosphate dehydrogenase (NAD(P)+)
VNKVAVIGAGSWGTTVAALLSERVETWLWARSPEVVDEIRHRRTNQAYLGERRVPEALCVTADAGEALEEASLVVLGVPSHGMRSVLEGAACVVVPSVPVLSLSKGLEEGTDARMSEVIADVWPGHPVGVLTGPNLAEEVFDRQPTAAVVAIEEESLARELQDLFTTDRLRVYTNPDLVGCEIAGVVKNVMAIACGMAVGLGYEDNTRGALITRALAELTRLGVALGGEQRTFAGLAGIGDLVATCTSGKSRNFRVGVALGEGRPLASALGQRSVAEGVRSCRPVVDLARRLSIDVPLAEQVVAVCHEGRSPADSVASLMARAPRSELDDRTHGEP